MAEARIRRAGMDDAEIVAQLHVDAWRESYASMMPPEALSLLSVEEQAERWRDIFRSCKRWRQRGVFGLWRGRTRPAVSPPAVVNAVRASRRRVFRWSFRRFICCGGRSDAGSGAR